MFKQPAYKCFKEQCEILLKQMKEIGSSRQERKTIKRNHMEILELKNIVPQTQLPTSVVALRAD